MPKVQKIAQSGHTGSRLINSVSYELKATLEKDRESKERPTYLQNKLKIITYMIILSKDSKRKMVVVSVLVVNEVDS